jgi:hypothetical protein
VVEESKEGKMVEREESVEIRTMTYLEVKYATLLLRNCHPSTLDADSCSEPNTKLNVLAFPRIHDL